MIILYQSQEERERWDDSIRKWWDAHRKVILSNLRDDHTGIEIVNFKPIISYHETMSAKPSQAWIAKSENKLAGIGWKAEPLADKLCIKIEKGVLDEWWQKTEGGSW